MVDPPSAAVQVFEATEIPHWIQPEIDDGDDGGGSDESTCAIDPDDPDPEPRGWVRRTLTRWLVVAGWRLTLVADWLDEVTAGEVGGLLYHMEERWGDE